ncbi:MAG: hypothetical protein HKO66_16210 [Saprospiraceae bacterium]|nr:hypothetical protein [Bacteroidia bacterium]NNE13419.1 hypothetical protein [Saprospiraceae bacterium]NNL93788.1 hypothetical protein [Saprospiraceae bacterium]
MYIYRNISLKVVLQFAWINLLIFTAWNVIVYLFLHHLEHEGLNPHIPFLPLSTIGIAVAFYIGFKNNASYDRFWEARKIWGGIVNYSRTWANQVLSFITPHDDDKQYEEGEIYNYQKQLIYTHIAWINALRLHLRKPNPNSMKHNRTVKKALTINAPEDNHWRDEVFSFLPDNACKELYNVVNKPTQIIRAQGQALKHHRHNTKLVEDFRHMEMMRVLEEFYNLQGKCERIKNTPFPRQYGYFSKLFTWIFIALLPFGLLGEFAKMGHTMEILAIPFSVLISWIFLTMEIVGDNSEDPFENFINDVPMTALCRTIEIDLREMLGEKDLPPKVEAVNGILM